MECGGILQWGCNLFLGLLYSLDMTIEERVLQRVSELLSVPVAQLTKETKLADIVPDSLTYFSLFLELEHQLNKKLSFEEVLTITTLGDVVHFVEQHQHDGK